MLLIIRNKKRWGAVVVLVSPPTRRPMQPLVIKRDSLLYYFSCDVSLRADNAAAASISYFLSLSQLSAGVALNAGAFYI